MPIHLMKKDLHYVKFVKCVSMKNKINSEVKYNNWHSMASEKDHYMMVY